MREASPEVLEVGPSCQLPALPRLPSPMQCSLSCSSVGAQKRSQQLQPGVGVLGWSQQLRPLQAREGLPLPDDVDGDIRERGHLYPGGTPVGGVQRKVASTGG